MYRVAGICAMPPRAYQMADGSEQSGFRAQGLHGNAQALPIRVDTKDPA